MQFYLRVQPDEDAVAASPKKTAKPKKAMKRPAAVDHTKEPEPSEQAASDEGTRTCVHRTPKLSGFVTCIYLRPQEANEDRRPDQVLPNAAQAGQVQGATAAHMLLVVHPTLIPGT